MKRCLLLERKAMTNLDSIFKSRDITLPTKVCLVKVMVFPVVRNGCESWAIKKAEHQRIDAFELWCWRRLFRVPWTAEIKPVHPKGGKSWIFTGRTSWSSNTLATWCKELTHWKRPWCWERLRAGGEGDDRGWDGWMASPTQWTWVWASYGSWWWTGKPGVLQSMGCKDSEMTEQLNWTELILCWGEYSISQISVYMSQLIDIYQSKLWWSICHVTLTGYLKGSCKATPRQILAHNLSWASSKIALQIVISKICWVSFFYNSQKQKKSGLKKVGKTTRPFRYDLNQIPYDYTVEVINRRDFIWQSAWRTMNGGS